ncbi:DASH complex subunit Ask1-domain-containing protein [Aspergillus ambiguus]|uniref:DASH complex subunit Ask1-domain-containing protein n=1 Tax=Aspergillus ambiguus TaxID=176160 RepID=UPI003CCDD43F
MSRPTSTAQRPLTLTEELEKLEQSITLTLQEIDHNFSQAHRIVTSSILPLVEQYAEHSRDVWDGAKFWKQFFEASANVSLSGYEEHPTGEPEGDTTQDPTVTEDTTHSHLSESASYETPSSARLDVNPRADDDLELTSLSLSSHSTPRAPPQEPHAADDTITSSLAHPSPYPPHAPDDDDEDDGLPTTPGKPSHHASTTPLSSSPFVPPSTTRPRGESGSGSDPVLHRMLDKTYRVQATPLGKGAGAGNGRSKFAVTPKPAASKYAGDDSPLSSPEMEAPRLRAEIFSSPLKTPGSARHPRRVSGHPRGTGTPKPGTSVLTPARPGASRPVWDHSEDEFDDDDETFGPSPPKTMQFHVPQSRLMKTPAKEASKRIVEHLLYTAGANDTTDDIQDEQSPSLVRRMERLEDETF